jgi:hypothetical protein
MHERYLMRIGMLRRIPTGITPRAYDYFGRELTAALPAFEVFFDGLREVAPRQRQHALFKECHR